jgi:ADP-heptose:LPS heptosyltransferase
VGGGYDLLVDPQGTAKSALVNLASGIASRIGFAAGFCREFNHLTTTVHVTPPARRIHRVRKSLALIEAVGVDASEHDARYQVPAEAQAEADRELDRHGLLGKRLLLLHPGTSEFGARKRWPLDRFARVADEACAEMGLTPVFVLGPGERAWKDGLLSAVKSAPRLALEPGTFAHLGGMLARASCFVGCDSGPLHLASGLRVPVVGLYGPTDPVLFAPYYPPAVVVVKGLACSKCGAPHCNHPNPRMEAISVGDVMDGLRLLQRLTSSG